jgi:DNA-binding beta-propeller fold protein YncE
VSVIDLASNEVVETLEVTAGPWDVEVGPDGTLYVACSSSSQVLVFAPEMLMAVFPAGPLVQSQ